MSHREQCHLGGNAPQLYERYLVPTTLAPWAAHLVDLAAPQPGDRVLDVACGTGVVARLAARHVGGAGKVVGLDINAGMLAVARSLPPIPGSPVEWREGNAVAMPLPDAAFDLVLCQQGLQFFPDRSVALREMHRVLVYGGRLALSIFGPIERNPATHALTDALARRVRSEAAAIKRAEHTLADAEELGALVAQAGFRDVAIRPTTLMVRFPSPRAYVEIQLAATPLAALAGDLDIDTREALVKDISAALRSYTGDDGLAFPQEAHLVLARA